MNNMNNMNNINISNKQFEALPIGWFNIYNCNVYRKLFSNIPDNGKFIEMGCYLGRSIMSVSDIIQSKNLTGICIDLWRDEMILKHHNNFKWKYADLDISTSGVFVNAFKENIKPISKHIDIQQGSSFNTSFKFPDNEYDFIFIDANHNAEYVYLDIIRYLPKLKVGGILAGHDYNLSHTGVKFSVDKLLNPITTTKDKLGIWYYQKI